MHFYRYQGDRINEVGKRIEDALVHELDKQPLIVKKLPKAGYPDIESIGIFALALI
jgi:hypothetical protein